MNYAYLDFLKSIAPTTDDNCQKLADYLAFGLNYAIDLHNLATPVANAIAPTIPPIGSTIIYTVDTTANLKPDGFLGFADIQGILKIVAIPSPTTVELKNQSIDPNSLLITPYSLLSKTIAVRNTRSYDAIDQDASCYPVLKVFRQKESIDLSGVTNVDLVISYAMLMPNISELPGIMHWVRAHIAAMLTALNQIDSGCPFVLFPKQTEMINAEYKIMGNDLGQPVYTYLRMTISAREFS
jgi:hypothetical protein